MDYKREVIVEILSRQFFILYVVILIVLILLLCWLTSLEVRMTKKNEPINIQQYINSNKQDCNTNLSLKKVTEDKDVKVNYYGQANEGNKK